MVSSSAEISPEELVSRLLSEFRDQYGLDLAQDPAAVKRIREAVENALRTLRYQDEAEIFLADDGAVTVDASEQASIEMSDTPAGSSNPTVAASSTNLVSMWQTNSIAFRAERFVWYGLRRSGAIQWIDGFPTSC